MRFRSIQPDLWRLARDGINIYAIVKGDRTILIDTGRPDFAPALSKALKALPPLSDIVLTHGHYDHAGSAAALRAETGASVWIHPDDGMLLRAGHWRRPAKASPGLLGPLLKRIVADRYPDSLPAVQTLVDIRADGSSNLPGYLVAVAMPGHALGQVALRWTASDGHRVVFAADAAMHILGLREPILYENREEGLRSLHKLAVMARDCDIMLFGHGSPLRNPGARRWTLDLP